MVMNGRTRDAERTKVAILDAARQLFAQREISSVSIRDIAAAAGVSHGLVQQYFGNREDMVAGIIKHEVDMVMSSSVADADSVLSRQMLREGMESFQDFAALIARAALSGHEPEKMINPAITTPAMQLASIIARRQAEHGGKSKLDPKLVSAYINAALFGFGVLAPWLMTSAGLKPQDYRKKFDEILDITFALIELANGVPCGDE